MSEIEIQRRLHRYNASADAFGGRLQRPFEKTLRVLASTSLPVVGGYASARRRGYRLREIFSIGGASSQVAGSFDEKKRLWTTLVTSTIEKLNVNNVFFADKIVAQISIDHPGGDANPNVSFVGTEFLGLRLGDCGLKPVLKLDLCDVEKGPYGYPKQPCVYDKKFLEAAQRQSKTFSDFWLKYAKDSNHRSWTEHVSKGGHNSKEDIAWRGNVLCSMVESIEGKCPGTAFGHAIHIPDFGKVFLGELRVSHGAYDLSMVRLELGSPVEGQVSAAHASAASAPAAKKGSPGGVPTN